MIGMKTIKLVLALSIPAAASLAGAQTVVIDGKNVVFDAPPRYVNHLLMVPARNVFDTMGVDMRWKMERNVIEGIKGGNKVEIWVGSKEARLNDNRRDLDEAPYESRGRTYVPLKFLADSFGYMISMEGGDYVLQKIKP